MNKHISFLILSITLCIMLSSTQIQCAAELPPINPFATLNLWNAAKSDNLEAARYALAAGASVNGGIEYGNIRPYSDIIPSTTPLAVASSKGNFTMVKFLLEHNAMVDATTSDCTPLSSIFLSPNMPEPTIKAIAAELLTHKADVDTLITDKKLTPLMCAVYRKYESIVRQLILAGADINKTGSEGENAFDLIETGTMRKTFLEAWAINSQAFQELNELEIAMRTEILRNADMPAEDLVSAFDDAIPCFTNQGVLQPDYDLLNKRIAEQWTLIKEKLEMAQQITRLLSQQNCLPIPAVAAIVCDYLFPSQQ